ETRETREQVSRRLEIETAQMAAKVPSAPPKTPPPPKKKQPGLAKRPRIAPKKKMFLVETEKLNLKKAKLVTTTRYYMEKMDFGTVRTLLKSLVEIDPANQEYRKMLHRVDVVIEMEKERN
ncbi:MAG TPA: hypothetical protein VMT55_02400, partial [Candidatus Sulfotelmatobacter sp.]|nr:hypothetical protein [Candidatus Sulfotelmatobacter sp.]